MGPGTPLLSDAQIEFVEGPRSSFVASCDAARRPSLARTLGCTVDRADGSVTVLLPAAQAAQLLRDVAAGGRIAVVCNAPDTHRTLQIKGEDARCVAAPADAEARIAAHLRGFFAVVGPHGFGFELTQAIIRGRPAPPAAVRFTPTAIFEQTPGAQAGTRIGAR